MNSHHHGCLLLRVVNIFIKWRLHGFVEMERQRRRITAQHMLKTILWASCCCLGWAVSLGVKARRHSYHKNIC